MATDIYREITAQDSVIRLKTCLVTDSESIVEGIKNYWNNPKVSVKHFLADIVAKDRYALYIIDTEIQDMNIWPAPRLVNKNADAKMWLFLVSGPSALQRFASFPPLTMFLARDNFRPSAILEIVRSTLRSEARRQLEQVTYLSNIKSFFVRMMNGRTYILPVSKLREADRSGVTGWSVSADRSFFTVTQESGNSTEVPWDLVLYYCEPEYEYYEGNEVKGEIDERAARLGNRVKQLREEKGYSIKELAERAEMMRPNLSRLEHGRQEPSLETLERIARALNVPLVDVVATTRH
jgi:DNA-binding XRE family transcriptional regulator